MAQRNIADSVSNNSAGLVDNVFITISDSRKTSAQFENQSKSGCKEQELVQSGTTPDPE